MGAFIGPWLQRLTLPAAAIFIGSALAAPHLDAGIADGACHVFQGNAAGNDPTGSLEITLCREDRRVDGWLRWRGQSGQSLSHLRGVVDARARVRLVDMEAIVDAPNPGWVFCYDDIYDLRFDADKNALRGRFDSSACNDHGSIQLARGPALPSRQAAFAQATRMFDADDAPQLAPRSFDCLPGD